MTSAAGRGNVSHTRERFDWSALDAAASGAAGVMVFYLAKGITAAVNHISVGLSFFAGMLGWLTLVFLCNVVMAPGRIWRDDQRIIADLSERLTPVLALSFNVGTCDRRLRLGSVSESMGGNRFLATQRSERTLFVQVHNTSSVSVSKCNGIIDSVAYDGNRSHLFFDPIKLIWMRDFETVDIPPDTSRYLKFLVQPSEHDMPYFAANEMPFDYNFLFSGPGVYEMHVKIWGENTVASHICVSIRLHVQDKVNNAGKPFREYELTDVHANSS